MERDSTVCSKFDFFKRGQDRQRALELMQRPEVQHSQRAIKVAFECLYFAPLQTDVLAKVGQTMT